jgi:uncharacterized protein with GYD domain
MPLYLAQFAYTAETWTALAQNPQNREEVLRGLAEQFGCRLIFFAYAFGEYDGIGIYEAPDEATFASYVLAGTMTGNYKALKTTVLVSADAMVGILRQAGSRPFQPPGNR